MAPLDEMAMHFALASVGIKGESTIVLGSKTLTIAADEWDAINMKREMEKEYGCYETQEAIKKARETIKLVGLE